MDKKKKDGEEKFDITDTIEFISKSIRSEDKENIPVGDITSRLSKLADEYNQALADKDVALEKYEDINKQNYKLMQSNHELLMEKTRPLPKQNKSEDQDEDGEEDITPEQAQRKVENTILEIADEWKF